MTTLRTLIISLALAWLVYGAAAAATLADAPHGFTAVYTVMRNGEAMGTSTLNLKRDADGTWTYTSSMHASRGLAAMFGADVREVSRFRWRDGQPEALSYDYRLDSVLKRRHRYFTVDWSRQQVSMNIDGKQHFTYAASPGLLDRQTVLLAVAFALRTSRHTMNLPVAVKDRVQIQHFQPTGREPVAVPAGHFDAEHVKRIEDNKGFSAWYVPSRFLAPVKLTQNTGGTLTLLLKSYRAE